MLFDLFALLYDIDLIGFEFVGEHIGSKKSEGKKLSFWFILIDKDGLYKEITYLKILKFLELLLFFWW